MSDHTVPETCEGERCRVCGDPAAHKVEETTAPDWFHPMTACLCCACFRNVLGPFHDRYPYEGREYS